MDLSLTDEQQALVTSVTELLAAHSSPEVVRSTEDTGHSPSLWSALQEIGVVAMAVPETDGGWGGQLIDLCLVAERLGAALAPAPVVEVQVAARLLSATGDKEGTSRLAGVLAGTDIVTVAVRPARAGSAALVPAAAIADAVLVPQADQLELVPLSDANRTRVSNLASSPLADVDIDVPGKVVLASGDAAATAYDRAVDEWLVLTAAKLVGSATVAHRMTCAYAADRQTWGAPIGTYQGVSHPLADSATALDGARLLTRKAAWALDGDHPRARELAAMAFGFASETARDATYQGVHLHGGIGFTLEHDAQLHYRRVRGWARVWGEPRDAYLRVAAARYGRSA